MDPNRRRSSVTINQDIVRPAWSAINNSAGVRPWTCHTAKRSAAPLASAFASASDDACPANNLRTMRSALKQGLGVESVDEDTE